MELFLFRTNKNDTETIGDLIINGNHFCFTLEDKDRGLSKSMSLSEIATLKIHSETAIPSGRYEVVITYSDRFKKPLPLLLEVPGFAGVRIHSGNVASDTEGCILIADEKLEHEIRKSHSAFARFWVLLKDRIESEKVFITIN